MPDESVPPSPDDSVRASLSSLIRRVRRMIGDKDGDTWEDADVQDALDANQTAQRYAPLIAEETRTPGGWAYLTFFAPDSLRNWEADVVVIDGNYGALTPTVADLINGRWTFAAQPALPVYATGATYDLYGTAADLLEAEAASVKRRFDMTDASGAGAKRSQMVDHMLTLAAGYRAKQPMQSGASTRSDEAGGSGPATWAGRGCWQNLGRV